MSRDNLSSLLDDMLEESATQVAADEVREAEAREREERERRAAELRDEAKGSVVPTIDDVEQLTGLPDRDFLEVLGAAAPDDILVVLATASDSLQRAILRNMSEESVRWLRENLAHIDHVHDAERDGARAKMLKVANKLLVAGKIGVPEAESVGKDAAPLAEERDLRELLTDLVRIAEQSGPAALAELLDAAGEPLLKEGIGRVLDEERGETLVASLAKIRATLERRYAQRLEWMSDAITAIADGESADTFRARLFE